MPESAPRPNPPVLDPWPDRLRNLATIMVIGIHVSAPIAHAQGCDFIGSWWWAGNFWNSLTRPAVPLFVMLSGYLLLSKDYVLPLFLKRRFARVLIPAVFWMLIYSFYNFKARGNPATIADALKGVITGPVHYHFWFIYLIIGLYLIYPVLRGWVRTAQESDYLYFLIMCAIGTWGYKILAVFAGIHLGIHFELFTNNCGYFVLGYYLGARAEAHLPRLCTRSTAAWLIVLGTIATMGATYVLNVFFPADKTQTFFYDYLTPNVAVSATGWFLLVKIAFNRSPLLDIERDFSAASFGIYFVHVLVMDWWGKTGYWHSLHHPAFMAPILAALIAMVSFMVISLIRVMPGGQKIT